MFLSQYSGQYVPCSSRPFHCSWWSGVGGRLSLNRPLLFPDDIFGDQAVPVPPGGEAILFGEPDPAERGSAFLGLPTAKPAGTVT